MKGAGLDKVLTRELKLESRERIPRTDGELRLTEWRPWVQTSSARSNLIGVFERWQKNTMHCLAPEMGEAFKEPPY